MSNYLPPSPSTVARKSANREAREAAENLDRLKVECDEKEHLRGPWKLPEGPENRYRRDRVGVHPAVVGEAA